MTPSQRFPFLRTRALLLLVLLPLVLGTPGEAASQAPSPLDRELRVFLDCGGFWCDQDFMTEEIPWVDFVTDRQVADVHVLVSRQSTGAGGTEYTLRFIGRDRFDGRETTLRHVTAADATEDDRRRGLARTVQLGIAPLAAETPVANRLSVSLADAGETEAETAPQDDPWKGWVFRANLNSFFNGQSSYRSMNAFGSFGASRTTTEWKQSIGVHGNRSSESFEINDSTTVEAERESYGTSSLVVRSISDHWSVGGHSGWRRSTVNNYNASVYAAPAIEYSFFPYAESTRQLLTLLYTAGLRYHDYTQRTIFGHRSESLVQHQLTLSYDATQPWGSIDAALQGSHYITSLDGDSEWPDPQYNLSLGGGGEVRLIRGLSLRLNGYTELVRDQIELAAGDLTPEEILTQQRELATAYRYFGSFGLTYRFGSIYSAVVNPRFDSLD